MAARPSRGSRRWLKPGVLVGSLIPFGVLIVGSAQNTLGANPIAEMLNRLGVLALIFLIATLACTPLRILFDWSWPGKLRRMLGLTSFFYACMHVLVYAVADHGANFTEIWNDVSKRPFILVGLLAFAILLPLTLTSTAKAVKRLGGRRWQLLHRIVYAAGILGVIHFLLRVKKDLTEPAVYGLVLVLLLAVRLIPAFRRRRDAWANASGR